MNLMVYVSTTMAGECLAAEEFRIQKSTGTRSGEVPHVVSPVVAHVQY